MISELSMVSLPALLKGRSVRLGRIHGKVSLLLDFLSFTINYTPHESKDGVVAICIA
jgi:hypothetical protein